MFHKDHSLSLGIANQDENQTSGSTDFLRITGPIPKKTLTPGKCLEIQKTRIERNGLGKENYKQRVSNSNLFQII